ncbi:hypothetical protein BH11VER1_BH11VER1_14910 [soil metagenome]
MASIISSIKSGFHRDIVTHPVAHGWVLNLYRAGERYPLSVCDYFQSEHAPDLSLAAKLRLHQAQEEKHVHLFAQSLRSIEQPVVEMDMGDVFNFVVRAFTPGTFHILESDHADIKRFKLANFLAHAHHLEKRVSQSFAYHLDACERAGRDEVTDRMARIKADEDEHVRYTREAVLDLLTWREAQEVMDTHRRAEAKANLHFSQRQVKQFLELFPELAPGYRRSLYRVCAWVMESAGGYA